MKKILFLFMVTAFTFSAWAFSPKLSNQDSRSYKYELKCLGTTHSSINSNTTIYLRDGCELKVIGVGSVAVKDGMECVIKNGKLSCK